MKVYSLTSTYRGKIRSLSARARVCACVSEVFKKFMTLPALQEAALNN